MGAVLVCSPVLTVSLSKDAVFISIAVQLLSLYSDKFWWLFVLVRHHCVLLIARTCGTGIRTKRHRTAAYGGCHVTAVSV